MTDKDAIQNASVEEELALLVDAVEDYAIFMLSPEGEIRSWNRGARRILGYEAQEVIGRKFSMFYSQDAQRKPVAELQTATRDGRVEDEGWRIRKDGTRFWADTVITRLRDKSGKLIGFAKVTRDLTQRREAEESLRQSEEIFRLLVASVYDYAIFMLDPQGNVATWNAGARRIKGYEPEEIIGRHFSTFYGEEDRLAGKPEWELDTAKKQGSVEDEGWRIRKDGTRFWANVVITAVFDSKRNLRGFTKVTRDMTDRKRAEEIQQEMLQQREARLLAEEERRVAEASARISQEANRAKDDFLMTLSHELRTPMTVILGWARLLPMMTTDDPMFHEALSAIARTAKLQTRLIDDVLDVSRIMSGKMRLEIEVVDVKEVVQNAIDVVRPGAAAKALVLNENIGAKVGMIRGDRTRLQQVIWNLLTNAVKFTPAGGTIDVSARRTSTHVEIKVQDTGSGIDPGFLPNIFEPFRQAETPVTRVHGGLGLGLSIVRHLTEAHGGSVAAESRGEGKGSTFTISLPIAETQLEQPKAGADDDSRAQPGLLVGMTILLVEDDHDSRELLSAALRQAGGKVVARDSAAGALAVLNETPPDLVITDIAMPVMDGHALAREIRNNPEWNALKIIALTAFPERIQSETSGVDVYLSKPIDPFELAATVARIARR